MDNSYAARTVTARAKNSKNVTADADIIGPDCSMPATPVDYQNIDFGNCVGLKDYGLLPYSGISVNGGISTAGISNNSGSYVLVGMASYRKFDDIVGNQEIFDFMQYALPPGGSVSLLVDLPLDENGGNYATQIDVFCDEVLPSLNGQRYDNRKFGYLHIGGAHWAQPLPEPGEDYCGADGMPAVVLTGLDSEVQGTIQVEAIPAGSPTRVSFNLSGPASMQASQVWAPYCFNGDDGTTCYGWDTTELPDGEYTMNTTAWGIFGESLEAPCGAVTQDFVINNTGSAGGGDSGTSESACAFHWVDWNGGGCSNMELAEYMDNTSLSGIWRLGELIPSGPEVVPSAVVDAALDARVGDTFKIPLAEYNGSDDYAICGFANVRLISYRLKRAIRRSAWNS